MWPESLRLLWVISGHWRAVSQMSALPPKADMLIVGHRCLLCAISGHCAVLDAPASAASQPASPPKGSGQASPRDNVVFCSAFFGGVLGMRRTFILHARGSKLPSDLLGLTSIRYGEATAAEMRVVNQKLRKAIENEGRVARIEGLWWHCSLTALGPWEPSAVSLIRISRDRDGSLELHGRCWQEDGKLSARYWSEAVKERKEPSGIFYYWKEIGPGTRTHRSWTGWEKSSWSPPIARPGTSQLVRTRPRARTRGPPVFTGASIQRTWLSWTETTKGDVRS